LHQLLPRDPTVRVERRLAQGDAATEILQVAKEVRPDVIVMGTQGRTGLARVLMGSVAEQVVRKAACPVITVKTLLARIQCFGECVPERANQPLETATP